MRRKKINFLGFLSLLSLIGFLGFAQKNSGLYGFFGFAYYVRYFWVIPDEMFLKNVQKVSTLGYFTEMIALVLFMYICEALYQGTNTMPMAFGLSFAVSILVFTAGLLVLEWKEGRGAVND